MTHHDDELQRAILNNIPDQAWLKDVESRYILVNDAFMAACQKSEAEIIGKTPDEVWPVAWGEKYKISDRQVMQSGQRYRYEEQRRGADGHMRWYDTIKTPIYNESGEVIGTTGISRDITDRKSAEQALLESRTQLRELSAYLQSVREEERTRIARELHDELGQSLTAIRIGLDVIDAQPGMPDQSRQQQIKRLQAIAGSTMESVQRIAADLRPQMLDELGLHAAVDWLLESFSERTGIAYALHTPALPDDVSTDISTAIFRVLQEALTNVSRHSKASHVDVAIDVDGAVLVMQIADNGRGIEPSTIRSKGLGLVGMRERVFMLGGRLEVESQSGEGTRIRVHIPLHAATDGGAP
ncbi:MAG: PAS domain-containing protein [Oxalicibacterium faecigallinarum]|uniref:PAS domain-containing sensor histidine kinase n=1 Tax=Oxalicibacterium faecigallinarum TaxID=573741 RepID=UPI0028099FF3|nr:PAS domain-containing protein [Oxalicibacterium faecigallinarum]MDQ7968856.1 PAS domain-containing protein [Oxalicibacterium faecigallinarum]